jgi:hypothetical protein
VPSLSLTKAKSESKPDADVDSLIARLGAWAELTTGGFLYDHKLSAWATYATDTHGDKRIWAGEFEWEPKLHLSQYLGIGSYHSLLTRRNASGQEETTLGYTLTAALHGEAGTVESSAGGAQKEGTFFRFGPRAKLILDPLFHKTLTGSVEYTRLFDVEGDSPEPEYLRAAIIWSPNEGKHWGVRLEYENGGLDMTQERVDQLTAGLQIRF